MGVTYSLKHGLLAARCGVTCDTDGAVLLAIATSCSVCKVQSIKQSCRVYCTRIYHSLPRDADCMHLERSTAFISVKPDERWAERAADVAAGGRPTGP